MIELGIIQVVDDNGKIRLNYQIFPAIMKGFELYDITVIKDKVVIQAVNLTCPFCGRVGVKEYKEYFVCLPCVTQIKKLFTSRRIK